MDFVPQPFRVAAAVIAYSLCSGTMLLLNKLAMYYGELLPPPWVRCQDRGARSNQLLSLAWEPSVPIPSFVTVIQLLFAIIIVFALQLAGAVPIDPIEGTKVKVRPPLQPLVTGSRPFYLLKPVSPSSSSPGLRHLHRGLRAGGVLQHACPGELQRGDRHHLPLLHPHRRRLLRLPLPGPRAAFQALGPGALRHLSR